MNLIYLTVGHNPFYVELLEFCLLTIHAKTDMSQTRIMVMCDESFKHHIDHLLASKLIHHIMITHHNGSPEATSMRKVEIFDFENIGTFDKVLYLDSDLICTKDLGNVFAHITKTDKLYVVNESTNIAEHNLPFFGLGDYTTEDTQKFKDNDIHVFSCGHFAFRNTPEMKAHFAQVRTKIRDNTRPFFYEQSFMNDHFNRSMATDNSIGKYICIATRRQPIDQDTCVIHFANVGIPAADKLDLMKRTYVGSSRKIT